MDRAIEKSVTIPLPRAEAWRRWTTPAGLQTFFAPDCAIALWPLTPFHVWFFPENPPGARGAEDLVLLSCLPERMLSFQWDAPPHLPEVRGHRNWVVVTFEDAAEGATRITLYHLGWRAGEQWDQAFDYFQEAWDVVLARLARSVREGPLDWTFLRNG
ncbi:MAG: SRPBCC domain-containing protein [Pseudomonadota bacterium]